MQSKISQIKIIQITKKKLKLFMLSKPYNKPSQESGKNSKIKKNNFYKIIHKLVSLSKHPEILTEI